MQWIHGNHTHSQESPNNGSISRQHEGKVHRPERRIVALKCNVIQINDKRHRCTNHVGNLVQSATLRPKLTPRGSNVNPKDNNVPSKT